MLVMGFVHVFKSLSKSLRPEKHFSMIRASHKKANRPYNSNCRDEYQYIEAWNNYLLITIVFKKICTGPISKYNKISIYEVLMQADKNLDIYFKVCNTLKKFQIPSHNY